MAEKPKAKITYPAKDFDAQFAGILAASGYDGEHTSPIEAEQAHTSIYDVISRLNDGNSHYLPPDSSGNFVTAVGRVETAGHNLLSLLFAKRSPTGRLSTELLIETPIDGDVGEAPMWVISRGGLDQGPAVNVLYEREGGVLTRLYDHTYPAERTKVLRGEPSAIGDLVLHSYESYMLETFGRQHTAAMTAIQIVAHPGL